MIKLPGFYSQINFSPTNDGGPAGGASPAPPASDAASGSPSPEPGPPPSQVEGEVPDDGGQQEDPTLQPFTSGEDISALGMDDLDEITLEEPDTGRAPQTPQPDATKDAKPSGEPAKPAPAATPPESPKATDQPETLPPSDPEGILQGLEQPEAAAALQQWLAGNTYVLSDKEKAALKSDAVGAIPGIMARVHFEAAKNTLKLMGTLVPNMIQRSVTNILQSREKGREALDQFFGEWPSLDRGKHTDLVNQFARVYRQSNPKASRADAIKFVGAAVHAHLGIAPQQRQSASTANGQHPGRTVTVSRVAPFAPARPGARNVQDARTQASPWDGLGQDFEE